MTDISSYLPKQSQTVAAIFAHHKQMGDAEQARGYLGASIIGHPCERYLWYTFRACCKPEFDGRMYRLFETGQLEEARFVRELRAIGCTVHDFDESTGKQFEVSAFGGHFSGHMDACVLGVPEAPKTWHVGEFKTHSAKSFAKLVKDGVKASKPQHYAQMMVYMHLTGMTRALYLARNKDNDELWSDRIRYDKTEAGRLLDRAEHVINATSPPERITDRPGWYECRYCDAKNVCWGSGDSALPIPSVNCRQCCHSTPITSGPGQVDCEPRWVCEFHKRGLSKADCERSCEDHLVLPGLIAHSIPVDYSGDAIEFSLLQEQPGNEQLWKHGKGGFSTKELTALPISALTNTMISAAKDLFGATATAHCPDDIVSRYPDARVVWQGPTTRLAEAWLLAFQEHIVESKKIANCDAFDCQVAEFAGGRLAIVYPHTKQAEIRQGIE